MYIEALLKYTKAELSKRLLDAEKQLAESNFKLRKYENKIKELNDKLIELEASKEGLKKGLTKVLISAWTHLGRPD